MSLADVAAGLLFTPGRRDPARRLPLFRWVGFFLSYANRERARKNMADAGSKAAPGRPAEKGLMNSSNLSPESVSHPTPITPVNTRAEAAKLAERRREILEAQARERILATQNNNAAKAAPKNFTEQDPGETNQKLAASVGVSRPSTHARAEAPPVLLMFAKPPPEQPRARGSTPATQNFTERQNPTA